MERHDVRAVDGPALLLTVGPAASGKSTLLAGLVARGVVDLVVSTDAIRAELGFAADETAATYVAARERVRAALRSRVVVALDATNVRASDRAAWRRVAADVGVPAIAVLVGAGMDLAALVARDAGRDRHVPADAIAEQLALAAASGPEVLAAEGFTVVDPRSTRLVRGAVVAA